MKRPCLDCGTPTEGSRCPKCAGLNEAATRTPAKREIQNSREWRKLSRKKLREQPLCEECLREGVTRLAVDADHIVPRGAGGALIVPTSELQSLCKPHHAKKTGTERKLGLVNGQLRKYGSEQEFLVG